MSPRASEIDDQRDELLAEVAILTYDRGLTQQEVAQRVGLSRSTISRLLDEARRKGIVEIYINSPFRQSAELQAELCKRFGLKEARVLVSDRLSYEEMLQRLGRSAAFYLRTLIKEGMIIGIAWGTAIYQLVHAFRPMTREANIIIAQMVGSVGAQNYDVSGARLAQEMARLLRGRYYELHAPLLVETPQLREALMQERDVAEVLRLARQADLAIVGIGSFASEYSSLVRSGYLREDELAELRQAGAVGDICAYPIDIFGREVQVDLQRRVVSITLDDLKAIPLVVGIAGGQSKAEAILGALNGGYLDVLITDSVAASEVLRVHEQIRQKERQ
jgi:deoxyribonucleoside regulator